MAWKNLEGKYCMQNFHQSVTDGGYTLYLVTTFSMKALYSIIQFNDLLSLTFN